MYLKMEILKALENRGLTAAELKETLNLETNIARLLYHYHKQGLVTREKSSNKYSPYRYYLARKGVERLRYLETKF